MRLTIGRKLNGLIITLQLLSIGGVVVLATQLFTSDLTGLLRKGTLDMSAMLAGRVRAEMKHVADRARMLGAASLEDFRYAEDRLRYIRDNLAVDTQYIGLGVYRAEDPATGARKKFGKKAVPAAVAPGGPVYKPMWRVVHPTLLDPKNKNRVSSDDFNVLDEKYPLDFAQVSKGRVDFTIGKLKDGTPLIRMAIPFVQRADRTFSQILVVELHQERLTALFSEATAYTSYLVDRRGLVLGSTDLSLIPLGENLSEVPIVKALGDGEAAGASQSGQMDFADKAGEEQMGAFQRVGFAGLTIVSQVPVARATVAQKQLYRRTAFLAGAFLCLALALGFVFSQSITRPIQALALAAKKVKDGDFSIRLKTKTRKEKVQVQDPETGQTREEIQEVTSSGGDEVQEFSGTFNEMVKGLEERDKVKATFAKFHSKEMAEKVLSGELELGGERKNATVFFSDVRGFTAMSEKLDPEALVKVLNRYMSKMVQVILSHNGIVDKYVGDAIMAVWGAPMAKDRDTENAVLACLGMRKALAELNEEFSNEGLPLLKIGMGLNYGPLIAGNIGSEERMEYTVIGDTVNTASRIESLTKEFGTDFLISQAVLEQLGGRFIVEKAHEAKVKGKSEPLVVYKVHGYTDENGQKVMVETAFSSYAAEKSDKVVHDDKPAQGGHAPAAAPAPVRPALHLVPDPVAAPVIQARPAAVTGEVILKHLKTRLVHDALASGVIPLEEKRFGLGREGGAELCLDLLTLNLKYHEFVYRGIVSIGSRLSSGAVAFVEVDPEKKGLFIRAVAGLGKDRLRHFHIPLSGELGRVVQYQKPFTAYGTPTAGQERETLRRIQTELGHGFGSILAVPVLIRQKGFGAIVLVDRIDAKGDDPVQFSNEDVLTAEAFAEVFGRALEIRFMLTWAMVSQTNAGPTKNAA